MNLNGRVKRLEQNEASKRSIKQIKYWDDYTPEQRAEMEGKVFWIKNERPPGGEKPNRRQRYNPS